MIRQIAPLFFTIHIPATLAYYKEKLGFECLGTWHDPPIYAIVARDWQVIHFRCAEPPTPNPNKYSDELLDAYLVVEDADALYAEYAAQGVEFTRGLPRVAAFQRLFQHCRQSIYFADSTLPATAPYIHQPGHSEKL
jgi:hypothetical protein